MTEKEIIEADFLLKNVRNAFYINLPKICWSKKASVHDCNALSLILEGSAAYMYNGKEYNVTKGTILLQKTGELWEGKGIDNGVDKTWSYMGILFDSEDDNILELMPHVIHDVNIKFYYPIFKEIIQLSHLNTPLYKFKRKILIYNLLSNLIAECSDENKFENKRNLIVDSLEYINQNIYNPFLSITEAAKKSNISEDTFRNIFKSIHDVTPSKYIIDIRLNYAKELLNYTNYNISHISEQIGYTSEVYFYRLFKKKFGITPSQYRRDMRVVLNERFS